MIFEDKRVDKAYRDINLKLFRVENNIKANSRAIGKLCDAMVAIHEDYRTKSLSRAIKNCLESMERAIPYDSEIDYIFRKLEDNLTEKQK